MLKSPRFITKDCPDLPASFAVVSACSHEEAFRKVMDAFQHGKDAVILSKASQLMPKAAQQELALYRSTDQNSRGNFETTLTNPSFFSWTKHSFLAEGIKDHFASAARLVNLDEAQLTNFSAYQTDFLQAAINVLSLRKIYFQTRSECVFQNAIAHYDTDLDKKSFRVLDWHIGDSAQLYEPSDIERSKLTINSAGATISTVFIKSGGQPWVPEKGSMLFFKNNVVHASPSKAREDVSDQKRLFSDYRFECYYPVAKKPNVLDFIAHRLI